MSQSQTPDSPGQLQHLQEQLFLLSVLLRSTGVQLKRLLLEEWQHFSQGSQLYQVQEVEVAEPLGPLTCCELLIKTLSELSYIVTPLLMPAVCEWKTKLLHTTFNSSQKMNATLIESERSCGIYVSPSSRYRALRWMLMLAWRPEMRR